MNDHQLRCGDCLRVMRVMPSKSVNLTFCSPPYVDCRTYGIGFRLRGQDWVDWAFERFVESLRVTNGLVAWVIEGKTKDFRYDPTPMLLAADLHRAGVCLRKPPIYARHGIPGSGGGDWLKNRYELIICATHGGPLPWSDNTAMGAPCKYGPGGAPSHRRADGTRANGSKTRTRRQNGSLTKQIYVPPRLANPGNIIDCGSGGGGHLGSALAHENEAPFPEALAEFIIKSFCPPGGIVLDPFCGSGTTLAVAARLDRQSIGIDNRRSQIVLSQRRLREALAGS